MADNTDDRPRLDADAELFLLSYEDVSYCDRDIVVVGVFSDGDRARGSVVAGRTFHMHRIKLDRDDDVPVGGACMCELCVERVMESDRIRKERLRQLAAPLPSSATTQCT
jgi:hypothetical protein